MLKIRKNVEMPAAEKSYEDYPLEAMALGDSFIVPGTGLPRQKVSGAIQGWRLLSGSPARFKTAYVPGGVGVWRTE